MTRREAWLWLIAHAAHTSTDEHQRGDLQTTYAQLAERWRWTKSRAHHFVEELVSEGMLEAFVFARGRSSSVVLRIVEYDRYQSGRMPDEYRTNAGRLEPHGSKAGTTSPDEYRTNTARKPDESRPENRPSRTNAGRLEPHGSKAAATSPDEYRTIVDDSPPTPPLKEQKQQEEQVPSSSQRNQDHSAQATPPSADEGGGGNPPGERVAIHRDLVEFLRWRDGVVTLRLRSEPSKDVKRRLREHLTYDKASRIWAAMLTEPLRALLVWLTPGWGAETWGLPAAQPAQGSLPGNALPPATTPASSRGMGRLWPSTCMALQRMAAAAGLAPAVGQALATARLVEFEAECIRVTDTSGVLRLADVEQWVADSLQVIFGQPCSFVVEGTSAAETPAE
jgi:hypothetical protein